MDASRVTRFRRVLPALVAASLAACGLPGLGVPDEGTDPAVIAESIETLRAVETWTVLTRSGDGVGARFARLESGAVPAADRLVRAGDDAVFDLQMELYDTPTAADEEARVTEAWILREIGDLDALPALGSALYLALDQGLFHAANALADAIFALLDDPRRDTRDLWYDLAELEHARDAASDSLASGLHAVTGAATATRACVRRMLILGADGNPLTTRGTDGTDRPLAMEGWEYDPPDLPAELANHAAGYRQEVLAGEGTPVEELGGDVPNRRFNCAGFAFRELNEGHGWNTSAPDALTLLQGAGLLQLKPDDPVPGDKVFYLPKAEWWAVWRLGAPAHVAEVHRVVGGKAVVRAPDNQTGVFDANIDARYFKDRDWVPAVYEWVAGPPRVREDFDVAGTGKYCAPRTAPPPKPCGDGRCDVPGGENVDTCGDDCRCGDDLCDPVEKGWIDTPCYLDCGTCGDGYCAWGKESPADCEADCGACGNGTCEESKGECILNEVGLVIQCAQDCCPGGVSVCPGIGNEWCTPGG